MHAQREPVDSVNSYGILPSLIRYDSLARPLSKFGRCMPPGSDETVSMRMFYYDDLVPLGRYIHR